MEAGRIGRTSGVALPRRRPPRTGSMYLDSVQLWAWGTYNEAPRLVSREAGRLSGCSARFRRLNGGLPENAPRENFHLQAAEAAAGKSILAVVPHPAVEGTVPSEAVVPPRSGRIKTRLCPDPGQRGSWLGVDPRRVALRLGGGGEHGSPDFLNLKLCGPETQKESHSSALPGEGTADAVRAHEAPA